jgi:hypothetical protein
MPTRGLGLTLDWHVHLCVGQFVAKLLNDYAGPAGVKLLLALVVAHSCSQERLPALDLAPAHAARPVSASYGCFLVEVLKEGRSIHSGAASFGQLFVKGRAFHNLA